MKRKYTHNIYLQTTINQLTWSATTTKTKIWIKLVWEANIHSSVALQKKEKRTTVLSSCVQLQISYWFNTRMLLNYSATVIPFQNNVMGLIMKKLHNLFKCPSQCMVKNRRRKPFQMLTNENSNVTSELCIEFYVPTLGWAISFQFDLS